MKFRGNKLLIMLIVLLAAAALLSSVAFAEGEDATAAGDGTTAASDEFQVSKSKTAEPTELNPDQKQTEITLSLPSGEKKYAYDIVFVMDSSSSTANSDIDFGVYAGQLMDAVKDKNIDLKVGVIKVRGLAFDTISLVTDNAQSGMIAYDGNQSTILGAINFKEADLKALSSGTNFHGGLVLADKWLSEDEDVPDDHKLVFFLIDGKTYIWNDVWSEETKDSPLEQTPLTVYGQYMASGKIYSKPAVGQQTIAYSKSAYRFIDNVNFFSATADELANLSFEDYFEKTGNFYTNDFAKLYASTNEELSQPTKYDYRCGYAYKESSTADGTVDEHALTNANYTYNLHKKYYEFVPAASFADLNWLQANPYTVEENEGVYSYTTTVNPDFYQLHPDSLQKALYLTGHLWTDMVAKYNGAAIVYNGWGSGSGLEIAKSFNQWIISDGISDYSADISNVESLNQMFDSINDDIIYLVSKGVVTDEIVSELDLVMDGYGEGIPFKLTVGDEEIEAKPDTEKENTWNFGSDDEGSPLYSVTLKDDKNFVWNINTRVENANPVTLSYWLEWNGTGENDTPTDTNVKATLDYWKSTAAPDQEEPDGTEEFEVPQVTYTEPSGGTLTIIKTVDGPADLPKTTKFNITGPEGFKMEVGIGEFEKNDKGEYVYTYPKSSEEASAEAPAEVQVKGAAKAAETLAPGEYTVTENKSSAMVDGYTLHILGDNGVPRQVDENGYTFRIRNRYADPSEQYVPEELNGEDHYAYMIGYPDGLVHPERNITRAEVATIFFRLLTDEAREANLSTVNSFGDVEDGMWFNVSVSTMANMGIVNGYPDGDFHPNDNITRAEFAAIAARFDKEAKDSANIFTDIDGHWAKSYILRAVNRGWINGYPDSTFRPDRLATRAEVAAMVNRVLVRDPEDPDDLLPDMIEWPDNMDTRAWYYLDIQEATNTHEYERQTKPTEVWMQLLENPDWTKYQY